MQDILEKAACYIAIIVLGFVLRRTGFFGPETFGVLSKIVMKITLPCAIIASSAGKSIDVTYLAIVLLGFGGGVLYMILAALVHRGRDKDDRAFAILNTPGYNIGTFALPFTQSFLGPVGVLTTSIFDVGNAFVYGDLKAVDTVTYEDIGGEYMYVEKVKERYTKHTRAVTKYRTVNGKRQSYTTTETYWTWDVVDRDSKKCEAVTFLGVVFDSDKIRIPSDHHIDTISGGYHIRYKYYGVDTEHIGTIFTDLRDDTISDRTPFYKNSTIPETVERLQAIDWTAGFWVLWIILMAGACYGFCYLDNRWLE